MSTEMILIDSTLSPSWLTYLGAAKVESVHWMRMDKLETESDDLLGWAVRNNATILTGSGHFTQTLALRRLEHPSVIYLRTHERNPDTVGKRVVKACRRASRNRSNSMVITIDEHGDREHALPIVRSGNARPKTRKSWPFALYGRLRKLLFSE
jgi:predicted nuclease of predicted toxin-antitoxin system